MDIQLGGTDSLLAWAIVNAITNLSKKEGKDLREVIPDVGERLDVVMTVNGVEVDLENTFKEMRLQDEQRIKEEAALLVNDKINSINDFVENVRVAIINELASQFGIYVGEDV